MKGNTFKTRAKVWVYEGNSPWYFATINKKVSVELKKFDKFPRRGFGSIRVLVTLGKSKWKTSVFPQKTTYLLPLKKEIRKAEKIVVQNSYEFVLEVIDN